MSFFISLLPRISLLIMLWAVLKAQKCPVIILYGRLYTKYQFVINEVDTFAIPKASAVYRISTALRCSQGSVNSLKRYIGVALSFSGNMADNKPLLYF